MGNNGIIEIANELEQRLDKIKVALHITPDATPDMMEQVKQIDSEVKMILLKLKEDETYSARNASVPQNISSRMNYIYYGTFSNSGSPTKTMEEQYDIVKEEIELIMVDLTKLINVNLKNLEDQMEKAGAPYTPGRIPVLK